MINLYREKQSAVDQPKNSPYKKEIEQFLMEITENVDGISLDTCNDSFTSVSGGESEIAIICYQENELRIVVNHSSKVCSIAKQMIEEGIADQKTSTKVLTDDKGIELHAKISNAKRVLVCLFGDINIAVPLDYSGEGQECQCLRCGHSFYSAKRCPECGQLVKYKG